MKEAKLQFHFRDPRQEEAINKGRRAARIRIPESPRTNWREKLHPFFLRMAEYNKRIYQLQASSSPRDREEARRLALNPPDDLVEEAHRVHDELEKSGSLRYRPIMTILGVEDLPPGSTVPESRYMLWRLSWYKYAKTPRQLLEESNAGSEKASRQLLNVMRDYDKWRFGKTDVEKQRFKTDIDHHILMMAGLDLGIDKLTAEELADCFDSFCVCGEPHSAENLRKLRTRIMKALVRAKVRATPPGSRPKGS